MFFLSYAHDDREAAAAIKEGLAGANLPVWLDSERIGAGDSWIESLEKALRDCSAYLILIGGRGVDRWVRIELNYALNRRANEEGYRVIPLLLHGIGHDALPPFLSQFQSITLPVDLLERDAPFYVELASALESGHSGAGAFAVNPSAQFRDECPFPGLESFDEDRASFFYGRHAVTLDLVGRLGRTPDKYQRWLQIEGPSGTGKSSLLRAGLIPAVRKGWVEGAARSWHVALMRPGNEPVRNLARALTQTFVSSGSDVSTSQIEEIFLSSPDNGLRDVLDRYLPAGHNILLAVDQLEELFTLSLAAPKQPGKLDALLATALRDHDLPFYLTTTIRSDFVGYFRRLPELEGLLNAEASRYYLSPMSEQELLSAVTEPARLAGLQWEKGLPERICEDARTEVVGLPLIAHTLRALWENRTGNLLTNHAYQVLGGVVGALSKGAGKLLATIESDKSISGGKERARAILLSLVQVGRGSRDTRRTVRRSYALAAAGGDDQAELVLARLSGGRDPSEPPNAPALPRLVVVAQEREDDPQSSHVDLVHEALLDRWEVLRRWIEEDRRTLERREDLEAASKAWEAAGAPEEALPSGPMLAYYEQADLPAALTPRFLVAARLKAKKHHDRVKGLRVVAAFAAAGLILAVGLLWQNLDRKNAYLRVIADNRLLQQTSAEGERLWPNGPDFHAKAEPWLEAAQTLEGRAPEYQDMLAGLDPGEAAYADTKRLVEGIASFSARPGGGAARVEQRLALADRWASSPELGRKWQEAAAAIRNLPAYAGLGLEPQYGLVPLGPDPRSQLWEFADWRTGSIPRRGADGQLVLSENSALVFVLLPAKRDFSMGQEAGDPHDKYNEPDSNERPVNRVSLDAFFLSKYEMTQGQWLWIAGKNPSVYSPSTWPGVTLLHPVESVSWETYTDVLGRLDLLLPTEAQWEYGTRGGQTWPWWTGPTGGTLIGQANLDGDADGYAKHCPVDAFPPNPFGLYNVHGNVWEWCRDPYSGDSYNYPARPGDGLRLLPPEKDVSGRRAFRSGGYEDDAKYARASYRYGYKKYFDFDSAGARPSRRIE